MSEELYRILGHVFLNPAWLKLALTHRSSEGDNNERLEFLGDAIVNLIVAEALYHQFPNAPEGILSRCRANLISRDTLGELGRSLNIGRYLHLGLSELRSGGGERLSILSCAMEAIIGAIYCDAGYEATRECVLKWYQPLLVNLTQETTHKDPKTQLQELLQKRHVALPIYIVESTIKEDNQQYFIVSCSIKGTNKKTQGQGTTRRRAEQEAALQMLGII